MFPATLTRSLDLMISDPPRGMKRFPVGSRRSLPPLFPLILPIFSPKNPKKFSKSTTLPLCWFERAGAFAAPRFSRVPSPRTTLSSSPFFFHSAFLFYQCAFFSGSAVSVVNPLVRLPQLKAGKSSGPRRQPPEIPGRPQTTFSPFCVPETPFINPFYPFPQGSECLLLSCPLSTGPLQLAAAPFPLV